MRDEIFGRLWADHGHHLSDDLHRLFKAVQVTFCKIAAINFAAPWRKNSKAC